MPAPTDPNANVANVSSGDARSLPDTHSETVVAPSAVAAAQHAANALGPYRIIKELGRGGMGAVYAAIDTRLDRRLALKVMLPQFAADAAAKERFLREARAAAKISHDNVVTVYEADERDGVPYIAMQFLEGLPLDAYLKKKGSPTVQQVFRIAAEAAAGLAAAHKLGLVHRDIKPANLWLEAPNGRVKVLDFGLAKPVDAEVELTKSGAVVGTPAYMSPEQARGERVDHRTDLFSLGAVMYRLCAGKVPFSGPTTMAVLMALGMEEPPPVREANPDVPEALAALIHQLLSKRADARPQSATEVVKRLRAIAEELAVPRALPVDQSTSLPHVVHPQVAYAVVPVTAPTHSPFADLDSPDSPPTEVGSVETSAASHPLARAKSRRSWLWPAVGTVALAAALVAGVIVIKNATAPAPQTDETADRGKEPKPRPPGPKPPPTDTSPDRKAAEWVLAQNASVRINGSDKSITTADELPKDRFTLTQVSLAGTKVTDTELAQIKDCKRLTDLDLHRMTELTDTGLLHVKELKALTHLHLNETRVTDASLGHLKELKNLTFLDVRGTRVATNRLADLSAALPGCKIVHDGGTIVPKADPDRAAAEWVIAQGCAVYVNGDDTPRKVVADLPKDRFALTTVDLVSRPITDEGAAHFKNCRELRSLGLANTKVTDVGLAHLTACTALIHLNVHATRVTDAGVKHLKGLKNLTHLILIDTQVSDVGLEHLRELKNLTHLALRGTKVTPKGLQDFHAAVPGCKIEHDDGTVEPKK